LVLTAELPQGLYRFIISKEGFFSPSYKVDTWMVASRGKYVYENRFSFIESQSFPNAFSLSARLNYFISQYAVPRNNGIRQCQGPCAFGRNQSFQYTGKVPSDNPTNYPEININDLNINYKNTYPQFKMDSDTSNWKDLMNSIQFF